MSKLFKDRHQLLIHFEHFTVNGIDFLPLFVTRKGVDLQLAEFDKTLNLNDYIRVYKPLKRSEVKVTEADINRAFEGLGKLLQWLSPSHGMIYSRMHDSQNDVLQPYTYQVLQTHG